MSPLIGSRGDFEYDWSKWTTRCSECHVVIQRGGPCLVSRDAGGRVRKKVCSQECRESFDAKWWDGVARDRLWPVLINVEAGEVE